MSINICFEYISVFEVLILGDYDNFVLFLCFFDGELVVVIVVVMLFSSDEDEYQIMLFFVGIMENMVLMDYEGIVV